MSSSSSNDLIAYPQDELKIYAQYITSSAPAVNASEETILVYRELQTTFLAISNDEVDVKRLVDSNIQYMRSLYAIVTTPHEGTVIKILTNIIRRQEIIFIRYMNENYTSFMDRAMEEYYGLRQEFCDLVAKLLSPTETSPPS